MVYLVRLHLFYIIIVQSIHTWIFFEKRQKTSFFSTMKLISEVSLIWNWLIRKIIWIYQWICIIFFYIFLNLCIYKAGEQLASQLHGRKWDPSRSCQVKWFAIHVTFLQTTKVKFVKTGSDKFSLISYQLWQ